MVEEEDTKLGTTETDAKIEEPLERVEEKKMESLPGDEIVDPFDEMPLAAGVVDFIHSELALINKINEQMHAPYQHTESYRITLHTIYKKECQKNILDIIKGIVRVYENGGIKLDTKAVAQCDEGKCESIPVLLAQIRKRLPPRDTWEHKRVIGSMPPRSTISY